MARTPRKLLLQNNSYFHVTWKCHNEDFLLRDERIKRFLYDLLLSFKEEYKIKIFAYCFMDNHPHIVGYCETVKEFSDYFHRVNSILARFINKVSGRKGQVIMDRFRSPQIETDRYLKTVVHYVDLNPVRAGICAKAKDYPWSSYRSHAHGADDPLLDPLPSGVKSSVKNYEELSHYILKQNRKAIPIYTRSYFVGSLSWVKSRRRILFDRFKKRRLCVDPNSPSNPEK